MMFQIIIQQRSRPEIENFLRENSGAHIPPLIPRVDIASFSRKIFDNAIQFWGFSEEKTAGFMACYFNHPSKEIAYITTLSIRPDFQGQDLGRLMTREAKKYAMENGFNRLGLEVNRNNIIAKSLYEKEGFNIIKIGSEDYYMQYKIK